jgi:hypothetical protein
VSDDQLSGTSYRVGKALQPGVGHTNHRHHEHNRGRHDGVISHNYGAATPNCEARPGGKETRLEGSRSHRVGATVTRPARTLRAAAPATTRPATVIPATAPATAPYLPHTKNCASWFDRKSCDLRGFCRAPQKGVSSFASTCAVHSVRRVWSPFMEPSGRIRGAVCVFSSGSPLDQTNPGSGGLGASIPSSRLCRPSRSWARAGRRRCRTGCCRSRWWPSL